MHLYVYIQVASITAKEKTIVHLRGHENCSFANIVEYKNHLRGNSRTEETIFTVTGFM